MTVAVAVLVNSFRPAVLVWCPCQRRQAKLTAEHHQHLQQTFLNGQPLRWPALGDVGTELHVEPFKTVLSGNREAIAKLSMRDLEKILAATMTGMSVEEFNAEAKKWLTAAKDPRWKRL